MEFIIANYMIFIVIAIILLLGLFGYMMDRKKYEEYREEIINEDRVVESLNSAPSVVNNVAAPITMNEEIPSVQEVQPTVVPVQTVVPTQTQTVITQDGGQN